MSQKLIVKELKRRQGRKYNYRQISQMTGRSLSATSHALRKLRKATFKMLHYTKRPFRSRDGRHRWQYVYWFPVRRRHH